MKKLLLLIMTMITSLVYSQNQLLGFETAETGGLDGGPFGSGIYTVETGTGTNTTKVLKVEGNTGGDVWQGINLNLSTNVQLTTSKTMTIDVFSNSPITFLVKCTGGVSGAPAAAAAVTHNGNGTWQTLSFTFNSVLDGQAATANGIYSKFVIHTYWATGATAFAAVTKDSRVFYVDNIKGIASSVVDPVPSSSANNPTHPNSDVVLSLFSDKPGFTNNYTPEGEFGSRTLINLDAENDQTIKMNFASDGWGQYNNTTVNISTANYLHFNYYAPNLAAGVNGHEFYIMLNSGSGEKLYTITAANMVFDTWQTISIPMSHFTALGFNKATLQTWKLGTPSNLNTKLVYFDNIYFTQNALGFAATSLPLIQDFDTASSLTTPAAFEGLASSTIVSDPVSGGTRGNVLKMQLSSTGQPWQGSDFSQLVKKAKLTTNKTMKIDVYATQAFNLLVKVETGGPASATAQAYTTPNQWQTLTFDFNTTYDGTAAANGEYSKLIFFGNWKSTNDGFISPPGSFAFHIDNIRAEAAAIVAITPAPTVAAPTPPSRLPSNVVSIFSGAYTNISPINYDAGWCGASSIEKTTAGGDSIIAYKDKPCQGIDFSSAVQNLTGFTHIHIDLFIAAGTSLVGKVFNLKVAPTSGAESEFPIDINALSPAPVPGTWYSYDVPVSFSGPVSSIKQFGITSDNLNNKVWYDNLYFYKNTPTTGLTQAPTPTRAASNVISVFSDAYTSPSAVNTNPNWGQSTQSTQFQISGNNTILFKNLNYQGIVFNDTNYRMNLTAAGMTHLHIDYQTKQTGTFKMFLISPGPKEASYNLTIPTTGWNSLDIPLTSFPAPVDLSQVFQIKFDNGGGTNFSDSILIDNIYFYKSTATTSPVPLTPAPTPTRAASNVKSIYSDAYTNVSVNEWGPAWGPEASTITDFPISGNATKVINMTSGKVFAGIDFAPSKFNATEYTHFHFDYWTPTPLNAGQVLNIKLSNHDGSGESNALEHTSTSLQTGQWVSLDIPLANFTPVTNANKGNIAQIVLSAARASLTDPFTIYFDNVYFYKSDGNPTPVADSIKFPLTFEQTSLNYNFLSVGNATTKIVSNPNIDASNSSPLVAKTTKASGSIPLSGASIQFPTNIDLTNATSIKIQVWSPLAFIKVKVRLQSSSNPNKFIDIDQILNTPNSWQELDFVLPRLTGSAATEYQKFAVFFDADNAGTGIDFYFDNVRLLKSTSGIAHASSNNMTIYPNPAKNFIRLESLVPFDMVEIYSIHGKRVLTKAIKGLDLEIDIKHLSQGQYILRTYGDGKMTNFHFIKD